MAGNNAIKNVLLAIVNDHKNQNMLTRPAQKSLAKPSFNTFGKE
ncbi:hypothetical protein [uncultured Roseobacter sp.]|nr:hypothetical protein [uncultured Roseobacter sp.]